jgi:hypothetical protein
MRKPLSADAGVNLLFERAASEMRQLFGYSEAEAWALIVEYYRLFTDSELCSRHGVVVQDADFFFHEAPLGMALRVQYFVGLKGLANRGGFLDWRMSVVQRMRGQ